LKINLKKEKEKKEIIQTNGDKMFLLGEELKPFNVVIKEEKNEFNYLIDENLNKKTFSLDYVEFIGESYSLDSIKSNRDVVLDNQEVNINDTIMDTITIIPFIFYINCVNSIGYKKTKEILFKYLIYFLIFKNTYIIQPYCQSANKFYNLITKYHKNEEEKLLAKYICDMCYLYNFRIYNVFLFNKETKIFTNNNKINNNKKKQIELNPIIEAFYIIEINKQKK